MSSRKEFEAALEEYKKKSLYRITGVRLQYFQAGWSARDAEIAAKDARIAELEAALYCENSPYEAKTHRCVHCDEEVLR